MNAAFDAFKSVAALSGLALTLTAVAAAIALSIGPAIAFEAAFANVEKTVDGTDFQLDTIRSGILDLSTTMPLAATEIAKVAAAAGQIGVQTPDLLEFTETMIQLGTATDLSADQAAISMARFTAIMQVPIDEVPLLGAALVELGNNSAASESEILKLSLRLAAAGSQIGLTSEEVLGISAAMRSLGIEAESGGSSMSRVLQDIVRAVEDGGPKLQLFAETAGMTTTEFKNLVEVDPAQALLGFFEGLQNIEAQGGSTLKVLGDLDLDSIRLLRTILSLVAGGDQLADSLGLVANEAAYGGALIDEYGRFAETTSAKIQILKDRINVLAINLGTPTLGAAVTAIDGLGDAFERVAEVLTPLANEVATTFGLMGDAVGVFFDLIGGPALQVWAAAWLGAATVLTGILEILNSFGPAGIAIVALAADIAFVGPASQLAQAGITSLTASVAGLTSAGKVASAVFAVGPWLLIAGLMVSIGKSFSDAGNAAEEAGDQFKESIEGSFESTDLSDVMEQLDGVRERLAELNELDKVSEGWGGGWESWGAAIQSVWGMLPGVANTTLEARAEIEKLEEILKATGLDNYAVALASAASALGITADEAHILAQETGVQNELTSGITTVSLGAIAAMREQAQTTKLLAEGQGELNNAFLDGSDVMVDWANLFGVSVGTVAQLANEAGIPLEDLLDRTKWDDNLAAIDPLVSKYKELSTAIGISVKELIAERDAIRGVIEANDELSASVDAVTARRAAQVAQVNRLTTATDEYNTATAGFADGTVSAEELSVALGNLNVATAQSGIDATLAATHQAALAAEFITSARNAGLTDDVIRELLISNALLLDSEIADLSVKGLDSLEMGIELTGDLAEILDDELTLELDTDPFVEGIDGAEVLSKEFVDARRVAILQANHDKVLEIASAASFALGGVAEGNYEAQLLANSDAAILVRDSLAVSLNAYDNSEYFTELNADPVPAVEVIRDVEAELAFFVAAQNLAYLQLDPSDVLANTDIAEDDIDLFRRYPTLSTLILDPAGVLAATEEAEADIERYRTWPTDSALFMDESDVDRSTEEAKRLVQQYKDQPKDSALFLDESDVISSSAAAVAAIATVQSKTVTITTNYRSNYDSGLGFADGGMFANSNGGIYQLPFASYDSGGLSEQHIAQIARGGPGTTVRMWAEQETGGEAYIPLAIAKRQRSMNILNRVASIFGQHVVPMAHGGIDQAGGARAVASGQPTVISSTTEIFNTFEIQVNASGLSAAEAEAMTEKAISKSLKDFSRGLSSGSHRTRVNL